MKRMFLIMLLIALSFAPAMVVAASHQHDESYGYRYRITFEVQDEVGKMNVYVYTNTWVYTGHEAVLIGNPHPDFLHKGYVGSVIVPRCMMLVGKGILIEDRADGTQPRVQTHDGDLAIMQEAKIHDFTENKDTILPGRSECHRR